MSVERPAAAGAARDGRLPASVRVLLVDEHPLFRWGLRDLLERNGVEVVGEADGASGAVAEAAATQPDVILMDLRLAGRLGVQAIRDTLAADPGARLVVLSDSAVEEHVVDALVAGACGYLLKGAPADQLLTAVRAAARGEDPIAPNVAGALLRRLRAQPHDTDAAERIRSQLTSREREVLRRVGRGQAIRDIARELDITPKTARNHLSNLLGKLELENRVQASLYAARAGLLDEPVQHGAGSMALGDAPGLGRTPFLRGPASAGVAARLSSRLSV